MRLDNGLDLLEQWVTQGWLRPLDWAFAHFLAGRKPDGEAWAILGAALTSYQVGRGHICLDLEALLADAGRALSLLDEERNNQSGPYHPASVLTQISKAAWEKSLLDSGWVNTGIGDTPLVLCQGRLYLRRFWQYEQQVTQGIIKRLHYRFPVPANLCDRLDLFFSPLRNERERAKRDIHWQSIAAAVAAQSAFSVVSGGPGTGKTTAVVRLLGVLQAIALEQGRKLRIFVAAPTGKAAARLTSSIGDAVDELPERVKPHIPTKVTTLHRLLGTRPETRHFVHHAQNPLHADLLVIDEASMIDMGMMAALLEALPEQARLILIGDKDQLASVEAGAVLGDLCRNADQALYNTATIEALTQQTGYDLTPFEGPGTLVDQHIVVLRKSHRFDAESGIGALSRAVNSGLIREVLDIWEEPYQDIVQLPLHSIDDEQFIRLVLDGHSFGAGDSRGLNRPLGYREYLKRILCGPAGSSSEEAWMREILSYFNRFQLIAALRKGPWGVSGINEKVAEILFKNDLIPSRTGWYPGRPVLVLSNDYNLGLMNGDIGIVLPVTEGRGSSRIRLKVIFPMADGSLKAVRPSRLGEVETVYAMTVHKSQGSEFEHTALVLPETMNQVLTRELIYTGITRARKWFTLVGANGALLQEAIQRRTHRASGLADLLFKEE